VTASDQIAISGIIPTTPDNGISPFGRGGFLLHCASPRQTAVEVIDEGTQHPLKADHIGEQRVVEVGRVSVSEFTGERFDAQGEPTPPPEPPPPPPTPNRPRKK
jgi:hypothetical protein